MRVSVCMIVRNEESNIIRALSSIPSNYEVIVVDTGSKDHTVALARGQGAKVYSYEWCDDFAAARNAASALATGDYILVMDADEQLAPDAESVLQTYIYQYPSQAGAVSIENRIDHDVKRHRMVRFFPNLPHYRFVGIVHEQLYDGDLPAQFVLMDLTMQHYGYEASHYEEKQKAARYLPLYERHLGKFPNDGYMLYQMGKLFYSLQDYDQAERYLQQGISQQERNRLYFPVMLVLLGYTLKEQGKVSQAEQLLQLYESDYLDFPDLPFLQGLLAMDTGKVHMIEQSYLKALSIGETTKYTSVDGVGSFKAAFNLGLYYELTGQTLKANYYYSEAAKHHFSPAQERLAFL